MSSVESSNIINTPNILGVFFIRRFLNVWSSKVLKLFNGHPQGKFPLIYWIKMRFLLLHWIVSLILLSGHSQCEATKPDPARQCTNSRAGLPACNFNSAKCLVMTEGWIQVKDGEDSPIKPLEGGYVYLHPDFTESTTEAMTGVIPLGKKAICVDFHFATVGSATLPVSIYIQSGNMTTPVHEIRAKTGGAWESTEFTCCLPNVDADKKIVIEAKSTDHGIIAIDHLDIRASNMPCENGDLACYPRPPSQAPLDPGNTQTCPSDKMTGVASCDFDTDDKTSLNSCGWEVSPDWDVMQKRDGSGYYEVLYATHWKDAILLSNIGNQVQSLCMEVQFAVDDIDIDLRNVFSVHIVSENKTFIWGEAYNYKGKEKTVYKRNYFEGLLPEGAERQIRLRANVKGLKIDYIHMRASDRTPPLNNIPEDTPKIPQTPKKMETLFSCPLPPASLVSPLCGLTPFPTQDLGSNSRWEDVDSDIIRGSIFPGKEHYLLYRGTGRDLGGLPANLTTASLHTHERASLKFSYALSGTASLTVYAVDEDDHLELVWSTDHETVWEWVDREVSIQTTGRFEITFNVYPKESSLDQQVVVGFADITVGVPARTGGEENIKDNNFFEEFVWIIIAIIIGLLVLGLLIAMVGLTWKCLRNRRSNSKVV